MISACYQFRDELSETENGLLLRCNKIVIPENIQARLIKIAHEGHQGISKTLQLIKDKVWFPETTEKDRKTVENCLQCQANTHQRQNQHPITMSPLPEGPWLDLSLDILGPLPSQEYVLVLLDDFSRFPIAEVIENTQS